MATGDVTVFEEFAAEVGDKIHDFAADTFKLGIVDNTATEPTAATASPRWADFSGNEVSTAGGYTANGETLANVAFSEAGGVATFRADNVVISQDGSGFLDGYWGIIYNDTATNDEAVAFVEMGGPVSEQAGDITFDWSSDRQIFTITVS